MINSTAHQSWLFYSPLARQASLLKDDLLDPVDQLLDDPALLELVQQCLAARFPASARTGRPGIAPDRLLRCCVMKHLKGWSFRDLARDHGTAVVCATHDPLVIEQADAELALGGPTPGSARPAFAELPS